MFERGCLESHTAKLTKSEAAKLLGNISSYNVPDRASRTRRKRHREYSCGFSKMHYRRKNQQNGFTKGIDPFVKRFSLCRGVAAWRRGVRTTGTIVSMDWNKRIVSLDERETTLEYIEESTLLRVLSILSAFERRRRVITVLSTERRLRFVRLHGSV